MIREESIRIASRSHEKFNEKLGITTFFQCDGLKEEMTSDKTKIIKAEEEDEEEVTHTEKNTRPRVCHQSMRKVRLK